MLLFGALCNALSYALHSLGMTACLCYTLYPEYYSIYKCSSTSWPDVGFSHRIHAYLYISTLFLILFFYMNNPLLQGNNRVPTRDFSIISGLNYIQDLLPCLIVFAASGTFLNSPLVWLLFFPYSLLHLLRMKSVWPTQRRTR